MQNGLINYGHMNAIGGSAFSNSIPDISLTMTPMEGLAGYINLVGSYKNNDVTVLAAFPKAKYDTNNNLIGEIVDKGGHIVDYSKASEIYDLSGDNPRIKKDFIIGAIFKKNNCLDEFYTREEIFSNTKTK